MKGSRKIFVWSGIGSFALGLVFAGPARADFLVLKSQKILVGTFREARMTAFLFDGGDGEREIPRQDVSRLAIGYNGIPVCFQTKRSETKNCSGSLFLLDPVRAVLGFPQPGKEEWYLIRMNLDTLAFMEMKKSTIDPALMPVIATGVRLRVRHGDDQETIGEIVRAREDALELRLPDGSKARLERGDIQSAEILLPGRELQFIPEPPARRGWWFW